MNQPGYTILTVCLICSALGSGTVANSQTLQSKNSATNIRLQRLSNAREKLIRETYDRLIEYNQATQILKDDLDDRTPGPKQDLKIELSNFHQGPILKILNKRYIDLITIPTGVVISISRHVQSVNKGPEEVVLQAEWQSGQYASGFDPEWTISQALQFEPTKYADVGTYVAYTARVSLAERSRTYQAIVLFHDLNQSSELGVPEFWDSVVDGLNLVWAEKRPPYKSKPEFRKKLPGLLQEEGEAGYVGDRDPSGISMVPDISQSLFDDSISSDSLLATGTSEFWLKQSYEEHASGSHGGTAVFTPSCTYDTNYRQRCTVNISNFETLESGTLDDTFGIWYHKGAKDSQTEVNFGPAGTNVSCKSAAGVAFSSCLLLTGCQVNVSVSANTGVGGIGATVLGGNLWRDGQAVGITCNLSGSTAGATCTTPGFDGSCPPGSTPNGFGLCCFSSTTSCTSLTLINKCYMYGGDYDFFSCSCSGCDVCGGSPIVVDINGDGIALTGPAEGVDFDLNGNGTRDRLGWTRSNSDDAWLALDRNGNGNIDNGAELFGDFTQQPAAPNKNGFLALAEFDKPANGGNGDGVINSQDSVFERLRLWQDANHNGIADSGELHTLPSLNVQAFELDFKESKRVDQSGNEFRYRAKVWDSAPGTAGRWSWDVFLSHDQ